MADEQSENIKPNQKEIMPSRSTLSDPQSKVSTLSSSPGHQISKHRFIQGTFFPFEPEKFHVLNPGANFSVCLRGSIIIMGHYYMSFIFLFIHVGIFFIILHSINICGIIYVIIKLAFCCLHQIELHLFWHRHWLALCRDFALWVQISHCLEPLWYFNCNEDLYSCIT